MWRMKAITIPVVIGALTCKERDGEFHPTDTGQHQNTRATEDHTTWNIAYPKKGTIHQIDFYLILTLGPRNGPIAQNLIVFRDIYLQCHNLIDAAYETTLTGVVLLFLQMIIQIWIGWRPLGIPDSFVRKNFMQISIRSKFKTRSCLVFS